MHGDDGRMLGEKGLRAHWRKVRRAGCEADRCLHPGQPIDYDGPRGPLSLDVGHIRPQHLEPERRLWLVSETRPEHATCNRSQGARMLNPKIPWPRRKPAAVRFDTSRAW